MPTEKEGLVDELHKQARRKYPRRSVEVRGLFDLWQADLVEMIPYSRVNKGYRYLLTVIDACSKRAWAEPVKSKSGEDVTEAMAKIIASAEKAPKNLQVDNGTEFYNSNFKELMNEHGINMYSSYSYLKASIVERFNRTLKTKMWKRFSLQGNYQWLDLLQSLLHEYNNVDVHRSIGMKPGEVKASDEKLILRRLANNAEKANRKVRRRAKFKVGDHVRLSKLKSLFEKGYTPNWGMEVFRVAVVKQTKPVTYLIEDLAGTEVKGGFYAEELQKTAHKDVYLVEKVLRRKGNKAYVKWLGFDSSHNEWIPKSDLLDK